MTPQGFPLWARRRADGVPFFVVGWVEGQDDRQLPVMVPVHVATESAKIDAYGYDFTFHLSEPVDVS